MERIGEFDNMDRAEEERENPKELTGPELNTPKSKKKVGDEYSGYKCLNIHHGLPVGGGQEVRGGEAGEGGSQKHLFSHLCLCSQRTIGASGFGLDECSGYKPASHHSTGSTMVPETLTDWFSLHQPVSAHTSR